MLALACAFTTLLVSSHEARAAGRYDALLAPRSACPSQYSGAASLVTQKRAMLCLVNYARGRQHLRKLRGASDLSRSSQRKSVDIKRCNQFAHEACGRPFDFWIKRLGYRGHMWGENIAWGSVQGAQSTPRSIMRRWLYSQHHREAILQRSFRVTGFGLVEGRFLNTPASVWVEHFGS